MDITLHGKRAVKVFAKKITWSDKPGGKAAKYNIDGDEQWIPHSLCKFTESPDNNRMVGDCDGTIVVAEWFYNKLFPNG